MGAFEIQAFLKILLSREEALIISFAFYTYVRRGDSVWRLLTNLTDVVHYCDGQARTCLCRGSGGVVDIKISGTVLWSSFGDINHNVSRLAERHTSL